MKLQEVTYHKTVIFRKCEDRAVIEVCRIYAKLFLLSLRLTSFLKSTGGLASLPLSLSANSMLESLTIYTKRQFAIRRSPKCDEYTCVTGQLLLRGTSILSPPSGKRVGDVLIQHSWYIDLLTSTRKECLPESSCYSIWSSLTNLRIETESSLPDRSVALMWSGCRRL